MYSKLSGKRINKLSNTSISEFGEELLRTEAARARKDVLAFAHARVVAALLEERSLDAEAVSRSRGFFVELDTAEQAVHIPNMTLLRLTLIWERGKRHNAHLALIVPYEESVEMFDPDTDFDVVSTPREMLVERREHLGLDSTFHVTEHATLLVRQAGSLSILKKYSAAVAHHLASDGHTDVGTRGPLQSETAFLRGLLEDMVHMSPAWHRQKAG